MKSKYTKKSGNKKNMKMRKTKKERKVKSRNMKSRKMRKMRKERKVKSRKMKSQVGGGNGEMDPELYEAVINKNGALAITLINSRANLEPLRTRQEIQNYITHEAEEEEKPKYEELIDVMDQYKYDRFNELKAQLDLKFMTSELKKNLTKILLSLINPEDLERNISIIENGKRKAVTLQL